MDAKSTIEIAEEKGGKNFRSPLALLFSALLSRFPCFPQGLSLDLSLARFRSSTTTIVPFERPSALHIPLILALHFCSSFHSVLRAFCILAPFCHLFIPPSALSLSFQSILSFPSRAFYPFLFTIIQNSTFNKSSVCTTSSLQPTLQYYPIHPKIYLRLLFIASVLMILATAAQA